MSWYGQAVPQNDEQQQFMTFRSEIYQNYTNDDYDGEVAMNQI